MSQTYIVKERQTIIVEYVVLADSPDDAKARVNELGCGEYNHFIECEYSELVDVETA